MELKVVSADVSFNALVYFNSAGEKAEEISTATINKLYYRKFAKKMQTFCFSLIVCVCTGISCHLFT